MPSRKRKSPENFKLFIGRAVIIKWVDDDPDMWDCFRIENVKEKNVSMSGMTNREGIPHDGSWVRAHQNEIKSIKLRD